MKRKIVSPCVQEKISETPKSARFLKTENVDQRSMKIRKWKRLNLVSFLSTTAQKCSSKQSSQKARRATQEGTSAQPRIFVLHRNMSTLFNAFIALSKLCYDSKHTRRNSATFLQDSEQRKLLRLALNSMHNRAD